MQGFNRRLKQLEKGLNGNDTSQNKSEHEAFMAKRTEQIKQYLVNDIPFETDEKELTEYEKELFEKYLK